MSNPYLRLMRLHQPTGIWLLLWPCWWSLALARHGEPSLRLLLLFGVGAVVMRAAGCIVNDLIDRKVDAKVLRTQSRPLASGEITPLQAVLLLGALLVVALIIALQMCRMVLVLAICALPLIAAYPFMKRITWWPQAFLGITFNWGALMGFAAVKGTVTLPALVMYAGCFFWTLGYDTIYAHQDKKDDEKIGIKSTARRLGESSKYWIAAFYALAVALWLAAGWMSYAIPAYYAGMLFAAGHLAWQVRQFRPDDPQNCMALFRSNATLGWIVFAGTGAINAIWRRFF